MYNLLSLMHWLKGTKVGTKGRSGMRHYNMKPYWYLCGRNFPSLTFESGWSIQYDGIRAQSMLYPIV